MFLILLGDPGAAAPSVEDPSDFFLAGVTLPGGSLLPLPEPFLGPKMAALSFTFTSSSPPPAPPLEEAAWRLLEAGKLLGRLLLWPEVTPNLGEGVFLGLGLRDLGEGVRSLLLLTFLGAYSIGELACDVT